MSSSASNFLQALVAVVAGNALYFLFEKYLPTPARHVLFKADLGMLVDFGICLILFLTIKVFVARQRQN
jgi:hypothetical protein